MTSPCPAKKRALCQLCHPCAYLAKRVLGNKFGEGTETISCLPQIIRRNIIDRGVRPDHRPLDQVRDLFCQADFLPALHGSSLFSRGNTQVVCTVTLGSELDAQRLDTLGGPPLKRFMLHYSFPLRDERGEEGRGGKPEGGWAW